MYINDYDSKCDILKDLININSKYLYLYEYIGAKNETQSLHAKVLSIDNSKSIITSSNLSYNGMEGNLELGIIIKSKDKAKDIRSIFDSLIKKRYFEQVKL